MVKHGQRALEKVSGVLVCVGFEKFFGNLLFYVVIVIENSKINYNNKKLSGNVAEER